MKNNIAKYRNKVGITQTELGKPFGWSQSRVANYEQGIREPKLDECRKITRELQKKGAKGATLDNVFPSSAGS